MSIEQEYTDFEKAVLVRRNMATVSAEIAMYDRWPVEYSVKEIRSRNQKLVDHCRGISVMAFTQDQCDALDFSKWSDDSELRLIPVWLYPHLRYGDRLTCIDGSTVTVAKGYHNMPDAQIERVETAGGGSQKVDGYTYIDNDHRFGALAYGIIPARGES